jgi:hypothetical protein
MDFITAWENRHITARRHIPTGEKVDIRAKINFKGGEATMVMPKYFKDEEAAMDTLHRAWNTYCKHHADKRNAIESIIVEEVVPFASIHHKSSTLKISA